MLDNFRREGGGAGRLRLTRQIVRWFYACSGREYSPRGISDSAPGGGGGEAASCSECRQNCSPICGSIYSIKCRLIVFIPPLIALLYIVFLRVVQIAPSTKLISLQ